ncbi:MAG: phenylacetate-CoA oxygenase subunit PaaC [Chitinophagaceae bacterium]|nr:phenylacetate-CoA oxygenase subunit PaaC [Chitinophagaceae bacterium]
MHLPSSIDFTLHLADDCLIMSQRLSEWTGHGPALEQDIALTNIALDMLGQARLFYQYAATQINELRLKADYVPKASYPVDEDDLAYHRMEHQIKSHLLAELPNGDWGQTILKVFFFSVYKKSLCDQLLTGNDAQLAAIAEKSLKEIRYHIKWSSDWVRRLGDGTVESHERMKAALDYLWPFTGELFEQTAWMPAEINHEAIRKYWTESAGNILQEATLHLPQGSSFQTGGLKGIHTEHMGYILAEMQYLQRVYPGNEW